MTYEQVLSDLQELQRRLDVLNVPQGAAFVSHAQVVSDFVADYQALNDEALAKEWDSRFDSVYQSMFVVARVTAAVLPVLDLPGAKSTLKDVLDGDLAENATSSMAKDKFFELETASLLIEAGFAVDLSEPDLVVSGNGLSKPFGIACKYPSSEKQIHPHLNKGYSQIARHSVDGCVAIGMDQLLFDSAYSFKNFRNASTPPQKLLQESLDNKLIRIGQERTEKYPDEHPVDAGIMMATACGIIGKPAQLAIVRSASLLIGPSQLPVHDELRVIHGGLLKVAT